MPATSDYSPTLAKLKELSEALPQAMRKVSVRQAGLFTG